MYISELYGLDQINGHGTGIWLGGNDEAVEGQFGWLPSGRPVVYNDWDAGQPDNMDGAGGQECMVYFYGPRAWHDLRCNVYQVARLICEGWYTQ